MVVSTEVPQASSFSALIEEGGEKLVWIRPKAPLTFRFTWKDIVFSGHLSGSGEAHRLLILGDLGPLPFSAEDPGYRERLMELVRWQPEDHAKFVLEPKRQHIFMTIDDVINGELTSVRMIASTIQCLYHIRPYFEIARDVGWKPPLEKEREQINYLERIEKRSEQPDPLETD